MSYDAILQTPAPIVHQLLQVIKHLNTKGAEDSSNLQEAAGEYEVEIQQILQATADRVSAFNQLLALQQEEARIAVVVKVLDRIQIHCSARQNVFKCISTSVQTTVKHTIFTSSLKWPTTKQQASAACTACHP